MEYLVMEWKLSSDIQVVAEAIVGRQLSLMLLSVLEDLVDSNFFRWQPYIVGP